MLSKTFSRWAWMVWELDAWPRISSKAGSDTKKNRGNIRCFFSRYLQPKHFTQKLNGGKKKYMKRNYEKVLYKTNPVRDFWHISSCSSRWGSSWPIVSSPTHDCTMVGISCARVMIFTQDLSMLEKRLASWMEQKQSKWSHRERLRQHVQHLAGAFIQSDHSE